MSDFDFLKEFGKDLDRERLLEYVEADWEKLAASLYAQERDKRRRRRMFALAFPLAASAIFILLGTLLWQTRSRADRMQAEIVRLQTELSSKNELDTTVQHIALIQYDTIYRTLVVQLHSGYSLESDFNPNNNHADSIAKKIQNQFVAKNKPQGVGTNNPLQNKSNEVKSLAQVTETGGEVIQKKSNEFLTDGGINLPDSVANIPESPTDSVKTEAGATVSDQPHIEDSSTQKSNITVMIPAPHNLRVPLLRRLRPHDAMIGFTSGMLFPQTKDAIPRNSYTLGLNGQIAFGRHLRLLAWAEHGWTTFKVNGSTLDNSNIPPPPTPPTPDDVFDYVQVEQPLWDFSLGLRYVFLPGKPLHPFIGAAWVGEQTQEQKLKYEYRNQVTEEEIYTLVPRDDSRFNPNGLQISLGAEWLFTKSLSLVLEGIYQRQYGTSVPLLKERWGLKTGLAYSF